jgi:hypothetical protein
MRIVIISWIPVLLSLFVGEGGAALIDLHPKLEDLDTVLKAADYVDALLLSAPMDPQLVRKREQVPGELIALHQALGKNRPPDPELQKYHTNDAIILNQLREGALRDLRESLRDGPKTPVDIQRTLLGNEGPPPEDAKRPGFDLQQWRERWLKETRVVQDVPSFRLAFLRYERERVHGLALNAPTDSLRTYYRQLEQALERVMERRAEAGGWGRHATSPGSIWVAITGITAVCLLIVVLLSIGIRLKLQHDARQRQLQQLPL